MQTRDSTLREGRATRRRDRCARFGLAVATILVAALSPSATVRAQDAAAPPLERAYELMTWDGTIRLTEERGGGQFDIYVPHCLSDMTRTWLWGPKSGATLGGLLNHGTLWERSNRAKRYEEVFLELAVKPLEQEFEPEAMLGLMPATAVLPPDELRARSSDLNTVGAGGSMVLDVLESLPAVTSLRYVKDQPLENSVRSYLRSINHLDRAPNVQALGQALSGYQWGSLGVDVGLAVAAKNAIDRDLALHELRRMETALAGVPKVDPALREGLRAAITEMEADPKLWKYVVEALREQSFRIGKMVAKPAFKALSQQLAAALKVKVGAVSMWAFPVLLAAEEIHLVLAMGDELRQASTIGVVLQLLESTGDQDLAGVVAYGQYAYAHHMRRSLDEWLQKFAGAVFGDIGDLRTGYARKEWEARTILAQIRAQPIGPGPNPSSGDLAIALCMDRSGSMQGVKLESAKQAARGLAALLRNGDKAALISFNADATMDMRLTTFSASAIGLLTAFQDRRELLEAIDRLASGGGTEFDAPLRMAIDVFRSEWTLGKVVLLLTDGQADVPTREVQELAKRKIPVYAIAFGSDAKLAPLQEIARLTGGMAYPAGMGNLKQVFTQIGGRARGESDALVVQGLLYPGARRVWDVLVPSASKRINATVQWPGSDIALSLRSPSGTVISEQTAAALGNVSFVFDPVSHTRSVTVEPAEAGTWEVEILGVDVPAEGEPFTVTASYAADNPVAVMPFMPEYPVGDDVLLALNVLEAVGAGSAPGAAPITASVAAVTARIQTPGGKSRSVTLRDDGSGGDEIAGDNVYSALFQQTEAPGFYEATFTAARSAQDTQKVKAVFRIGNLEEIRQLETVDPNASEDLSRGYVAPEPDRTEPRVVKKTTKGDDDFEWKWAIFGLLLVCAVVLTAIVMVVSRRPGGAVRGVLLVDPGTGLPNRVEMRSDVFSIGRDRQNSLPIGDPNASRRHAELRRGADGNWTVVDLGSANGTEVNGKRVTQRPLVAGDVIRIGETTLEIQRS